MEMDLNLKKNDFEKKVILMPQEIYYDYNLRQNPFHIFVIAIQKHFVDDFSLKVMILAQN